MKLSELLSIYEKTPQVGALANVVQQRKVSSVICKGLHSSSSSVVFASLIKKVEISTPFLFILNDEEEAGYFYHDLNQLLGDKNVFFFPSSYRRAVKYAQRDTANEVLRTQTLNKLSEISDSKEFVKEITNVCFVTYPDALCEKVPRLKEFSENTLQIGVNQNYDLPGLEKQLIQLGFKRKDYVYAPGEFAVRGSILDVYSFSSEFPYRIDFFGDTVDTIRSFEVQTQLSKDRFDIISIVSNLENNDKDLVPISDYFSNQMVVVTRQLSFVYDSIQKIYDEGFSKQAISEKKDLNQDDLSLEYQEVLANSSIIANEKELDKSCLLSEADPLREKISHLLCILTTIPKESEAQSYYSISFQIQPQPVFHKNFDLVQKSFEEFIEDGYRIYITADSEKQNERIKSILDEKSNKIHFIPILNTLHAGFSDAETRMCIFTDHQIFDRYHKYNLKTEHARDAKMALTLKELMQFQPGDFIVHINHGIGKFCGLVRMPSSDGSQQEMIKLSYQNDDLVFVSIHALHKLSKYKGKDGAPPRLSRLGTGAWESLKEKTKKKIKDIARDLIRLYSKRKEEQGFAFSADTFLQQELEASFTYEDTPDQLKVTQEVKADMESNKPMDRLVCGDVGFGKTEIAIRAAMKAAADNKQVAVLVPTTVLALQHYKTFARRLKNFPITIDYLSRARTSTQTKEILKSLEEGKTNIIIGTHKLIGKSVKFKDLGLLIIDEEQKFGVAVKEKLRQIKTNVDTLTMSATPIPRTLQFSLMGARDFSVISTPPPNRRPIQTEVHTFNHEIITEAINFEMSRNGQVFIVTNRISALQKLKELINKYVPDARVVVGHGQMPPTELEKIILDFANYDYDVLVSTTIVENGIDIGNANTIIIDAAHRFGLSDLHQMRGRVGRSDKKAFCYLLAPPMAYINEESRRRLQAIEDFSDLGAGIHIAMQDLDIRGAGNLLGAEQSGFIADLGYETYQKILSEAMAELRNEEGITTESNSDNNQILNSDKNFSAECFVSECNIDCDLHAFFPETYVPGASERMLLYRELDGFTEDDQIEAFRQRMRDRFGELPTEAEELLKIVPLRREGKKHGVERIVLKQGRMTLYFVSQNESPFFKTPTFAKIVRYVTEQFRICEMKTIKGKPALIVKGIHTVDQAYKTLLQM